LTQAFRIRQADLKPVFTSSPFSGCDPETQNANAGSTLTLPAQADYDDFCNHRATSLKSDLKDILAVTMVLMRNVLVAAATIGTAFFTFMMPLTFCLAEALAAHGVANA
jgi:hypothetical protein